jgi:hypothetical protein
LGDDPGVIALCWFSIKFFAACYKGLNNGTFALPSLAKAWQNKIQTTSHNQHLFIKYFKDAHLHYSPNPLQHRDDGGH